MELYYKGGYYLIKTKTIEFGANKNKVIRTCSRCINHSVFDNWCLSWMNEKLDKEEQSELNLSDEKIIEIQKWTDTRFQNGSNVFPDLKTAIEFKNLFLQEQNDIEIYTQSFSETDTQLLIDEFVEGKNTEEFNYNNGDFGLRDILLKKIEEDSNDEFLGYDFIGVECDGSFHSFHCHEIANTLVDRFSLNLNSFGLFDKVEQSQEIRKYLNDQETGLEPVPWYIVKVKRIKASH